MIEDGLVGREFRVGWELVAVVDPLGLGEVLLGAKLLSQLEQVLVAQHAHLIVVDPTRLRNHITQAPMWCTYLLYYEYVFRQVQYPICGLIIQ